MAAPKNVSWRLALLGLLIGGLLGAGALALTWDSPGHEPAPSGPPRVVFEHNMTEDERCAHMPEHCEDGGPS